MRTLFVIELLTALLAALAAGRYFSAPYCEKLPVLAVDVRDEEEARIRQQLRQSARNWEFIEAPLPEVIKWLGHELKIPVQLEAGALEDAGHTVTPLVTREYAGFRRDGALTMLTSDLNFIWQIRDGGIVITTTSLAEQQLDCCVYPVRSLVMLRDDDGEYDGGEVLMDLLMASVDSEQWEINGGQSNMRYLATTKSLLINAPSKTQQRVVRLLAALDKARAAQGVVQAPYRPRAPRPVVNRMIGGGGCCF